jgi:predicted SnoaL-like aldol condensation-catalyzing enzyme
MPLDPVCLALIDCIVKLKELSNGAPKFRQLALAVAAYLENNPEMQGGRDEFVSLFSAVQAAVEPQRARRRPVHAICRRASVMMGPKTL